MSGPTGSPTRGQEVTIRVAVEGDPKQGSMLRVNNFTATPQQELPELEYLGETETDYDFQHNGFSLQWEIHQSDGESIDMLDDAIGREREHLAPRKVTVTVIYEYRDPGTTGRIVVYRAGRLPALRGTGATTMARNPNRAPPPAPQVGGEPAELHHAGAPLSPAGMAFERMLLDKFSGMPGRRCPLPPQVVQATMVWLREQDSNDELAAAEMADVIMTPNQRRSARLSNQIESRESRRLSICAIWRRGAPAPEEVDHGVPFLEINGWSSKFWAAIEVHYLDLNGVPMEELQKALAGAVILGAPLPPNPNERQGQGGTSDER